MKNLTYESVAMRRWLLAAVVITAAIGCGGAYKEPTVAAFNGQLTHAGQPIAFGADERVVLQLVFKKNGERFGVPVSAAGGFDIGWMPIGDFSAALERTPLSSSGQRAGQSRIYTIADGLSIAEGQTQYTIELGDKFTP